MNKEEYHELLKDGRWQRKRLEIMQRDDFKCRECGTTNDLNVHHIRYIAGRKPWEYDNGDLITLCGSCHKATHEEIERREREASDYDECAWRVKQLDGLFLYYKQIGDLHDVITMVNVDSADYPVLYGVPFYWSDVMPYSPEWRFSGTAGANSIVWGYDECKAIDRHVWHNDPDEILTKAQFDKARWGFNSDKEWFEHGDWDILNTFFNHAEEIYQKREQSEKERLAFIEQQNQRIVRQPQKPSDILPKMSLSWADFCERHHNAI